jgi:recombination protein RecT
LVRDGITALRKVRNLAKCEHTSVLGGLMVCAQLGLRPGPMELIHLIPFWDRHDKIHKAQVVVDYKGYVQLAARAGTRVIAREVRPGDTFRYAYGLDDTLVHEPGGDPDGEATHYYAVAKWGDGQYAFLVWTRAQIIAHRDRYSKAWAKDGEKSIWGTNFDDQAKKTVVRQLRKWIPMSTELHTAMTVDGGVHTDLSPDSLDLIPSSYDDPNILDGEVVDDAVASERPVEQPEQPTAPEDDSDALLAAYEAQQARDEAAGDA